MFRSNIFVILSPTVVNKKHLSITSLETMQAFLVRLLVHAFNFFLQKRILDEFVNLWLLSCKQFNNRIQLFRQNSYARSKSNEVVFAWV